MAAGVRIFIIAFVTIFLASCMSSQKKTGAASSIRFVGDYNMPKTWSGSDNQVGGLSGLSYNSTTKRLLAVSDDDKKYKPRFYELSFQLNPPKFSVKKHFLFRAQSGKAFPKKLFDAEAIVQKNNGEIIISSEGKFRWNAPQRILNMTATGKLIKEIQVPSQLKRNETTGIFSNKGNESLTLAKNEQELFTATERHLKQDPVKIDGSTTSRIMHWKKGKGIWHPQTHYVYALTQNSKHFEKNELVELYHLEKLKFLSIERSRVTEEFMNSEVFMVDCAQATNVIRQKSLTEKNFTTCKKERLINVWDFVRHFKYVKRIDNIEGLAIIEENGKTYIVLGSDDNFRKQQVNQFLVFEWER